MAISTAATPLWLLVALIRSSITCFTPHQCFALEGDIERFEKPGNRHHSEILRHRDFCVVRGYRSCRYRHARVRRRAPHSAERAFDCCCLLYTSDAADERSSV